MSYDHAYETWRTFRDSHRGKALDAVRHARALYRDKKSRDLGWLDDALLDDEKKWFAAEVLSASVPKHFLKPMLRAAVYEPDPSRCRVFVEPCGRSFGRSTVLDLLCAYLRYGSNLEKRGAANAFYWAQSIPGGPSPQMLPYDSFVEIFIRNEDLDLRRTLVSWLFPNNLQLYCEDVRPLLEQAVQIAQSHQDKYIRDRIQRQLEGSGPIAPLPASESS